jgi:hypothetical protein
MKSLNADSYNLKKRTDPDLLKDNHQPELLNEFQ